MGAITGMGLEAPVEVTEGGGKHSRIDYRFDLLDARAMFALARILDEGAAKYGEQNWRGIPIEANVNHALAHIFAWLAGDTQDDHLGHAFCRLMFAKALELERQLKDAGAAPVGK